MMLPVSMHRDCSDIAPGARRMSNSDYHAGPGLSSSLLARIAGSCLADALLAREDVGVPSSAMMLGSAIHTRILGTDERVEVHSCKYASGAKRDEAVSALLDEGADVVIHADDVAVIDAVEAAVLDHPEARRLLDESPLRELSLFSRDAETGLMVRVRPDAMESASPLLDLKSTSGGIDPDAWGKAICDRGYHVGAALYRDVICDVDGIDPGPMHHIVVSTKPPHHVRVYVIGEDTERAGRAAYRRALDEYAQWLREAREHGQAWAGPSREVEYIDAPAWALRRMG
jgi:hypothetical protein